jgi:general secretion pathway protein D
MRRWNYTPVIFLSALLALPPAPLAAGTRKGDKLVNQARTEENKGNFDKSVSLSEQASEQDPGDPAYLLQLRRVRVEAGFAHLNTARQLRNDGHLEQAVGEFEKALSFDPSSDIARQEIERTKQMIDRNKNPNAGPGGSGPAAAGRGGLSEADKNLTPVELEKKNVRERIDSLLPMPELRPLNDDLIDLKMTNKPRVLFETVAKVAGVNVLFDPDYNSQQQIQQVQIDLSRTTLEQALDQLGVVTKSFWKPLSANTIFVTLDNPTKRREYAEEVVKVFYLSNATSPTELQELQTAIRTLFNVTHIMAYTAQSAIVVRAEADTMMLVEKTVSELDKPRSEVIVDVMGMEVSSSYTRNLAAGLANGLNTSAVFVPRPGITTPGVQASTSNNNNGSSNNGSTNNGTNTGGTGTGAGTGVNTGTTSIPFSALGRISSADYSVSTLPGATLEAMLSDSATRVLQAPQIRAADSTKATLNIGEKVPTASGSFQPGVAGVGVSPLVNTQFTYLDVGVNLEVTPHVHDGSEISMHLAVDISQVATTVNLGGIDIPEIAQNKIATDVRLHEGEVNLISGIIQKTDSRSISGFPGLANLPVLGHLFNSETKKKDRTELVIVLIPHIVRSPSIMPSDLQAVASGNETTIKVSRVARTPASGQKPQDGVVAGPSTVGPARPPATAPPATAPPATAPPTPAGPALPGGPARISFLPGVATTTVNGAVTVNLYAENVNDLLSASAHLQFDPKVLRITNISAGDLVQRNASALQPSRNILNEVGSADVSISRGPATPGVSGSGGLFSITFQAIGPGSTSVVVSNVTMNSSTSQPIPSNLPSPLTVSVK